MHRPASSSSQPHPTQSLALSSLHIRLEVLDKEHQWLLKQIKRKRTELNNFVEQMRSLATEIFRRCNPSFQKLADIDREIHTLFDEIFTTRKLGKQTKKDIEGVYRSLQVAGIISQKFEPEDEDTELDELFENNEQEQNFYQEPTENSHQYQETQQELEYPSANKNNSSRKVRQTFLRLAEIFHPDKVKDGD